MAVIETFRVKKALKTGGRMYFAGELLPEANDWPFALREQRVRMRMIEKVSVDSEEMEAHLAKIAAENAVENSPEEPPAPVVTETAPETDPESQEPEIPVLSESAVDEDEDEEISILEDEEEEEQEAEAQSSETAPTPKKIVRKRRG